MISRFFHWIRFFTAIERAPQRRVRRIRLILEALEDRTVPAAFWSGPAAGGNWDTLVGGVAANWTGGTGANGLPGANDDVTIANASVTHTAGFTDQIKSLALTNATLTLAGGTLSGNTPLDLLTVSSTASTFNLSGGTLQNASVSSTTTISASSGRLTSVTIAGTLDMTNNVFLSVSGALTLSGGLIRLGQADGSTFGKIDFIDGSPQTIAGVAGSPGTILFGNHSFNGLRSSSGSVLTVGPNLTVTGAAGSIDTTGVAFDNQGTITADPTAMGLGQTLGTITLTGTGWTNHGTIGAQNGGTLSLAGSWNNTGGTIAVNTATVDLGGSFATGGLGTITRTSGTGGTINLKGALDNTGALLRLGAAPLPGSWNLAGAGSITGGRVQAATGSSLVATAGTLTDVTLDGTGAGNNAMPFDMTNNVFVNVVGDLTLQGATVPLGKADGSTFGRFEFAAGAPHTVAGVAGAGNAGTILFGAHTFNGLRSFNGGSAVTFGPNLTVTGAAGSIDTTQVAFDNRGTIIADPTAMGLGQASGTITLTGTNWINHGTIGAQNGGTLSLAGSWSSAGGTIAVNTATVNLGGSFTTGGLGTITRTGGIGGNINLTGALDNTGATLRFGAAPLPGSWNLVNPGNITGGTVQAATGSALVALAGTLTNVTLDGTGAGNNSMPLDVTNNVFLSISGDLTLKGVTLPLGKADGSTFGRLEFTPGAPHTVDGVAGSPGTILLGAHTFNGLRSFNNGSAVTFGPDLTITGAAGSIDTTQVAFDNQGTITADPAAVSPPQASGTITLTGTNWINHGIIQAQNGGTISADGTISNLVAGTLTGGTWKAFANSKLRLISSTGITTNAANIVLDGANSNIFRDFGTADALANFTNNAAAGSFTVQNGRVLNLAANFSNAGTVHVDSQSVVIPATFYTQTAGTTALADGTLGSPAGLNFNGTTNFVSVPTSPSLNPTEQMTIEAWIKPNTGNNQQNGIAGTWTDPISYTYFLWVLSNKASFYIAHPGGSFAATFGTTTLQAGQWYHLTGTFDGTNLRLYVNGVLESTSLSPGPIATNTQPFLIGRVDAGGSGPALFNGTIGDVRLWNTALSQSAIQANQGKVLAGNETGLVADWRLNEGSGTTAHDLTSSHNDGALVNSPIWVSPAAVNLQGGALTGNGTALANVTNAATVAPGNSPGIISVGGDYTQTAAGTLIVDLNGTNAATPDFDQLFVTGQVSLAGNITGTRLTPFVPAVDTPFTIVHNDAQDAVVGSFAQGGSVVIGGVLFNVSYAFGDGNDVALITAAPPAVFVDDDFAGTSIGFDPVNDPIGGLVFGYNAFTDIQSAINQIAVGGALTVFGGTYGGAVDVNKVLPAIRTALNTVTPGQTLVTIGGGVTLDVDAAFNTTTADLTFNGQVGGGSGLTKSGNGTLTLTGANTYAGATSINGGTVLLNGSTGSGVNVNNGGTLAGSGALGGSVIVNSGGTVSPGTGATPGKLAISGAYTQNAGAILNLKLAGAATPGTDYDQITATGAASLDGTANVTRVNNFNPAAGDNFQIMNFASRSGDFATSTGLALGSGLFLAEQFTPSANPTALNLLTSRPLAFATDDHTTFVEAMAGSFDIAVTGFPAPSLALGGDTLPGGVFFMDDGGGTARLFGTPDAGTTGVYHLTFTAHNGVGSDAVQNFTLTISLTQPPSVGTPSISPTNSVVGVATTFVVDGTFTDPQDNAAAPFTATIHWGDNTTSPAAVTGADNPFGYSFNGTHTYAQAGPFNVTVSVTNLAMVTGTSAPTVVTVARARTTSTITQSSPSPSTFGQQVTFTVTVTPDQGSLLPTGTLTFKDGGTTLGPSSALVNVGGVATATITTSATQLLGGVHTITAVYAGDTNYDVSTSANFSHTVNPAPTTSTITQSSPSPTTFGQPVTFTVTVTPNQGTVLPTGTLTFKDGGTTLGPSSALVNVSGTATATFTASATQLLGGVHTITAVYAGDGNYDVSTSANFSHTVNPAATTSTITQSSPSPSTFGQQVTFTVTVTPNQGTVLPTGTLTFKDGGTTLGPSSALVNVGGTATATFTASATQLLGGAHTITAVYSGDTNYDVSTSANFSQTVNPAATTSTITQSSPSPSTFGQPVTFTVTVTPNQGTVLPTGTLTFKDGGTTLGPSSALVNVGGTATATFTASATQLLGGAHTITAVYSGDSNYDVSTSANFSHTVNPAATTSTITQASPSPSTFGQQVTFTVTVTPNQGTIQPTGTLTFKDGGTTLGPSSALVNVGGTATATFTTSATQLLGGVHTITAVYAGDTNYDVSTSANFSHTVNPAATTSTITQSSPSPSTFGQPVTFTVTVTPNQGTVLPTGTLTFKDGGTTLGPSTALVNVGGTATATFTTSAMQLNVGVHSITAVYAGDGNYDVSTSANFSHTVNPSATANWLTKVGSVTMTGNGTHLVASSATTNLAVDTDLFAANVSVQANVALAATGTSRAGLIARYTGGGDTNMYVANLIGNSTSGAVAYISSNVGGAWNLLATVPGLSGTGTLRFDVFGNTLKLFFNGALVASLIDNAIPGPGMTGVRGSAATFDNFSPTRLFSVLSFSDDFNGGSPNFDVTFIKTVGGASVIDSMLTASPAPRSVAVYTGMFNADVSVQADVALAASGINRAGLVARYSGTGDTNMYLASLVGTGASAVAYISSNVGGNWNLLATVPGLSGTGTLRFDVVGSTLTLFLDGAFVTSVVDNAIPGPGLTGVRGSSAATFDTFVATRRLSPPFSDNFDRPNSPDLGVNFTKKAGDLSILGNKLATSAAVSVAVYNGMFATDVSVQADVALAASGINRAGLVARYSGAGDTNMYYANVVGNSTSAVAYISSNVGGTWTLLKTVSGLTGTGTLRFDVVGDTLTLYLNGNVVASVVDDAIQGPGFTGVRGNNSTFDKLTSTSLAP